MKKLTADEALKLLEKAEFTTTQKGWIKHSKCVGDAASRIADALNLDKEKARALGYVHDIGKKDGDFQNHVMNGYNYIKELGYQRDYYNVCLTHGYLNNDVLCTAAGIPKDIPFRTKFIKNHKYTIYEKIINLCDLMCTKTVNTIDKRLIEIMMRRGVHENTQYHIKEAYKLKKYFDELLGYDVYDLFPEIKEHL